MQSKYNEVKDKKSKKKPIFPQKGLISIYLPKEKIWITGEGTVEALKNPEGQYIFQAYLRKNYD